MSSNLSNVIQFIPPPITGAASRVELQFDCDATAQINDIVYQDATNPTKVITNVNNTELNISIGVIIGKPTTTTCVVLILGINDGYTGLSIGSKIFLDIDGTITETKPSSGYVQILGIAVSTTQIFFFSNAQRVLQV